MAGEFDDLIPKRNGGPFDDLIPAVKMGDANAYRPPVPDHGDPGVWGALKAGASHRLDRLADGLVQGYHTLRGGPDSEAVLRGLKANRQSEDEGYERLRAKRPIATGVGSELPLAPLWFLPGGQSTALARLAAPAAIEAGVEGASYGSVGERTKNAAVGALEGAAGGVVGEALSRVVRPLARTNAPQQGVLDAAERLDFPLTAGQRSGSVPVQRVEDYLVNAPGSYGRMANMQQRQQAAVNRAASRSIGQDADAVTQDVLRAGREGLAATRDTLRNSAQVSPVHPDLLSSINKAEALATQGPKSLRADSKTMGIIDDFKEFVTSAAGPMDGKQYQTWRTMLNNEADKAFKAGDANKGDVYRELLDGLDAVARRADPKSWAANDRGFASLRILEQPNVVNEATGNVSPKSAAASFYRKYGPTAKEGNLPGELQDIALIGKGIRQYPEGSQTASRAMMGGLLAAGGGGAFVNPAAASVLGVPILNNALARILASPGSSRYLAEGLLGGSAQDAAVFAARRAGLIGGLSAPSAATAPTMAFDR
ncbi:MAG: hypothetical protein QM766_27575 [Burkholderiaceae bacterium]